ncbi:MAG: hypothetical protein U0931_28825 [Vulcanimicrobiota bacterium]
MLAEKAAEAGAIYARVQIRNKAEWKGDLNQTTINLDDFKVAEDTGNVTGWMQNASGQVALFRIRFNYQDGPGGGDGLDDPAQLMDLTYVSLNNVRKASDVPLPRAERVSPWNVVDPNNGPSHAPRGSMVLEVEGIAGNALSSVKGPNDPIPSSSSLTRRVLRVCYAVQAPPSIPTAAVSAGNGIEVESSSAVNVSVNGMGTATLRSKSTVQMKKADGSPNILNMNGKVGRDWSKALVGSYAGTVSEYDEHLGDGNDFFNLKWSDVPVASSSESKAVQIPGGVYVIQDDGHFKYYDMKLADYKASVDPATGISSAPSIDLDDKFTEVRSGANMAVGGVEVKYQTVKFDKDVNVIESTGKVSEITFTNPLGRRLQQDDTSKKYTFTNDDDAWVPGTVQLSDATLSGKSDVNVLINVNGQNGAITAEGNAVVAAPSVQLKKNSALSQQRLSLYVKKDLTLSTFTSNPAYTSWFSSWYNGIWYSYQIPKYEGYGQLDLDGLIYSWGNTTVYAGTPGKPSSGGNIRINGALVSYGADPNSTAPGSAGSGKVRLFANNLAEIVYDATKLVADPSELDESGPIKSIDRISYGFEN